MNKKVISLFLLIFISINIFAKHVTEEKAKQFAANFYFERINKKEKTRLDNVVFECIHTEYTNNNALYYIFNRTNAKGFIIISANDALKPVFAYSLENNFKVGNMPAVIKGILDRYTKKQNIALETNLVTSKKIAKLWGNNKSVTEINVVGPLLSTTWDEESPYNYLIINATDGFPSKIGGAGVAMAQLMKYYEYPASGVGNIAYYHYQFGTIQRNFNHTYDWSQMPNAPTENNEEIGNLMYDAGASVATVFKYYVEQTEYFVEINPSAEMNKSAYTSFLKSAFETYFKYSTDSEYKTRSNYTEQGWVDMIKSQIDLDQPVVSWGYAGMPHYWIFDGYDGNNIHFNFGLGGEYDAFYDIVGDNESGTDALINIYPSTYTSVAETNNSEIRIYPNPATNNLQLTVSKEQLGENIQILSITGVVIKEFKKTQSSSQVIQISDLQNGIYFIRLGDKIRKFIKN